MASTTASSSRDTLDLVLEFGGGTELLLRPPRNKKQRITIPARATLAGVEISGRDGDQRTFTKPPAPVVTAPAAKADETQASLPTQSASHGVNVGGSDDQGRPSDMRFLVQWILHNLVAEREELFVDADRESIRPGILVLINDADWELEGELDYALQDGDEICFISTLHGG
ncbi:unnamed protein product [Parajaminaea phylloscopi]